MKERIAAVPKGTRENEIITDGYDKAVPLKWVLTIFDEWCMLIFCWVA